MELQVMVPCAHMSVHAEISLITAACGCVGCVAGRAIVSSPSDSHRLPSCKWPQDDGLGATASLESTDLWSLNKEGHVRTSRTGLGKELEEGMAVSESKYFRHPATGQAGRSLG